MTRPRTISSQKNLHFKRWASLFDSHGIKAHRQCLVSGAKLRREIEKNPGVSIQEILLPPACETLENLPHQATCFELSKALFHELDKFGTKEPLLVCEIPSLTTVDLTQAPIGLEVLCPIGDPGNLGALLRSCWAFGVRTVILLQEAVHPFHPKVIRASSGAVFQQSLSWGGSLTGLNTPDTLKWITALDLEGTSLSEWKWPTNVRLLLGEEGTGIPDFRFSRRLRIPQYHPTIPLNVTVASSIVLYNYHQHHCLK